MEFKFKVGDEVRDTITKFKGIVIGRHQWLSNCNTYTVKSKKLQDGKPMDGVAFDEPQLELVEANTGKYKVKQDTGGPERTGPNSARWIGR